MHNVRKARPSIGLLEDILMIRGIFLDMDGVLTEERSSWNYVHKRLGIDNSRNFQLYREKKISYSDFFRRDIASWLDKYPDITGSEIKKILDEIPEMHGLEHFMSFLHSKHILVFVVSGGISWLASRLNEKYNFDEIYANEIITYKDKIQIKGNIYVEPDRKNIPIEKLMDKYNINKFESIAVGDSDSDYSMYAATGNFIAFNSQSEKLKRISIANIDSDISKVADYINLN
ncbi:MAG: HAD-IB family phosphatase [Ferroplasma sp.]